MPESHYKKWRRIPLFDVVTFYTLTYNGDRLLDAITEFGWNSLDDQLKM